MIWDWVRTGNLTINVESAIKMNAKKTERQINTRSVPMASMMARYACCPLANATELLMPWAEIFD